MPINKLAGVREQTSLAGGEGAGLGSILNDL